MVVEEKSQARRRAHLSESLPWLLFLLLSATVLVVYGARQKAQERVALAETAKVAARGLPEGFPLGAVPIPDSVKVTKCETGDAKSKEDEPMVHWTVEGESDAGFEDLHAFYKDWFTKAGWMQTQMISIPTGQSADYANDEIVVHLEIERPKSRKNTSFKLDAYKLVGN
jgi:hypothetical protein